MLSLILKFRTLTLDQSGQDLVEYALVVALIAFGAIAGMQSLAAQLNVAFFTLSSDLATAL